MWYNVGRGGGDVGSIMSVGVVGVFGCGECVWVAVHTNATTFDPVMVSIPSTLRYEMFVNV